MATVAVILTFIAGPGWYAKQTLYDTDTVVERVDDALVDPRVQEAIADKVTDELFLLAGINRDDAADALDEAADVDEDADDDEEEAEPTPTPAAGAEGDDDDPLADLPIAEALQTVAKERALAILASGRLNPSLVAAARESHEEFLAVINDDPDADEQGEVTINLDPVVDATLLAIADDPVLGFLSTEDIEVGEARFVVLREGQGGGVWWTILRSFPDWTNMAILGTVVLLGAAIVLSPERDRVMLSSGVAIAVIALVIAAGTWAARAVVATVFIRDEATRGAYEAVYDTLARPFISLEVRIAVFAAVLAAIGGIMGFVLDWRAERELAAAAADAEAAAAAGGYGYPGDVPRYQSPYENTGLPPGPQR